ncbi:UNVERIFIED_CONTAM: hypothetical protein Slati_4505200 [Sesamum latifolium]|uniref:Uncharacterized protein n=1 Tax=Sesamum latifolium TaxID=2727402 RepID=A0AAW2SS36_9LAMI
MGASRDGGIALPLKFALSLGAKQKTKVVEKDLLDDNMIHSSSTSSKAEIAIVMMVKTTSLKEQVALLTVAVGDLFKHVQDRDDSLTDSTKSFKSTVNEAIAKTYETRVQVFKSYIKPYTKRIEQLRMLENYQPSKFQQFNGHGDPRQHIAHFIEMCNNAGTDGDLLAK